MLFSHIPLRVQGDRLSRGCLIITTYIRIFTTQVNHSISRTKAQNEKHCLYSMFLYKHLSFLQSFTFQYYESRLAEIAQSV